VWSDKEAKLSLDQACTMKEHRGAQGAVLSPHLGDGVASAGGLGLREGVSDGCAATGRLGL